jgi:hypothetical protein
MKTIVVKMIATKTYKIDFDEEVFNEDLINNYARWMDSEIRDEPEEVYCLDSDERERIGVTEDSYPLFNMAKQIAFLKSEYDSLDNECMPKIHESIHAKKENVIYGACLDKIDEEYDYEFEECPRLPMPF